MDLQIALIIIGVILIGVVYVLSNTHERSERSKRFVARRDKSIYPGKKQGFNQPNSNSINPPAFARKIGEHENEQENEQKKEQKKEQEHELEEVPVLDMVDETDDAPPDAGESVDDDIPMLQEVTEVDTEVDTDEHETQHVEADEIIDDEPVRAKPQTPDSQSLRAGWVFPRGEQHDEELTATQQGGHNGDGQGRENQHTVKQKIGNKSGRVSDRIEPVFLPDIDRETPVSTDVESYRLHGHRGTDLVKDTDSGIEDAADQRVKHDDITVAPQSPAIVQQHSDDHSRDHSRDHNRDHNRDRHPPDVIDYVYPGVEGFKRVSQIDYWVKIIGDKDVGRESVLAQYREAASSIKKPNRIYGVQLPYNRWCDLEAESEDSRFGDLVVTLQLADATGPVSEADMDCFVRLIANLSEGTGRGFSFMSSPENGLKQGRCVSQFSRHYDSVSIINIKPQDTEYLEGANIWRCAAQLGMEQGPAFFIRNKLADGQKFCLYCLADLSATGKFDFANIKQLKTRGVTFFTRPAVNRSPGAVFSEMVNTAQTFAARVKGVAVTVDGEPLSAENIERMQLSIEQTATEMEENGLAPGSDEAMRIF